MANTFHLTIARVGETLFEGEAVSARFPGTEGQFTVLAHHEPFVSQLTAGAVLVSTAENKNLEFPVSATGVVEVSGGQATVLL